MAQKNYYVGVLLTASRNPLNKIQFAVRKSNSGKVSLFSRVSNFNSDLDTRKMKHCGDFSSVDSAVSTINSAREEMNSRGITVPGVTIYPAR